VVARDSFGRAVVEEIRAGDQDGEMWGGKRWTALAAVVVVGLIAGLAVVALVGSHQHAPSSSAASRDDAPSAAVGSVPTADASASRPLTSVPTGASWRLVDGVALPFSAADGPRSLSGGVASGFSRTSTGALLACVQTSFRIGTINPADQVSVVRAMVTGVGMATLLASRPAVAPAVKPQLAGFRYLSYSASTAVISLAWRVTNVADNTSRFVDVGELQVTWSDGDWRLVDDGSQPPLPTVLDSQLTGYVSYGGV
jgi:hypothetical protein